MAIDESDLSKEEQDWFLIRAAELARRFTARRINFYSCVSKEAARQQLVKLIRDFTTEDKVTRIGFADSVTLHQLDVFGAVQSLQGVQTINPFERLPDGKYVGSHPP